MKLLALIFAAAASHHVAASRFDLVCTGTEKSHEVTKPYSQRYAVDLAAKLACLYPCESPFAIRVGADKFDFGDPPEGDDVNDMTIDRTTGDFLAIRRIGVIGYQTITEAKCSRAAFTPFPKKKF